MKLKKVKNAFTYASVEFTDMPSHRGSGVTKHKTKSCYTEEKVLVCRLTEYFRYENYYLIPNLIED